MSIYIKTVAESKQDRLFTHHLNNVKNCKCGIKVLSISNGHGCFDTEKSSVFIFDLAHAEDVKKWITFINENPFDEIALDIEEIIIELRLIKNIIPVEFQNKVDELKQTDLTV